MFERIFQRYLDAFHRDNFRIEGDFVERLASLPEGVQPVFAVRSRSRFDHQIIYRAVRSHFPSAEPEFINTKRTFWQFLLSLFFIAALIKRDNPFRALRRALRGRAPVFLGLELGGTYQLNDASAKLLHFALVQRSEDAHSLAVFPVFVVWGKRPPNGGLSLKDFLFGSDDEPGFVRKLYKLAKFQKRRTISIGAPILCGQNGGPGADVIADQVTSWMQTENRAIHGPVPLSREAMIRLLMRDRYVLAHIAEASQKKPLKIRALRRTARKILRKMVADGNYTHLEIWASALTFVWSKIFDGLVYNKKDFERIREYSKRGTVVLVPSHKSHVDYLLVSYIFHINNLVVPNIAAGDNMAFWPMGYFFRKVGAYFIRRSFKDDPFYALLLERYIALMLGRGFALGFFIEGGRSRSGKLEKPKMGIISHIVKSMLKGASQDVLFVPVAVAYEKIVEEGSYIKESSGADKQKESFWQMLQVGKIIRKKYGKVYVNVGEAISTNEIIAQLEFPSPKRLAAKEQLYTVNAELAWRVADRINGQMLVTSTFLLSLVMLSHDKRGITLRQCVSVANAFLRHCRRKQVNISMELQNVSHAIALSAESLQRAGHLDMRSFGDEKVYFFKDMRKRLYVSYYKNIIVHHFLFQAFAAEAVLRATQRGVRAEFFDEKAYAASFMSLLNLFEAEFIYPERPEDRETLPTVALQDLVALGYISLDTGGGVQVEDPEMIRRYAAILAPFFATFELVLNCLALTRPTAVPEVLLLKTLINYGDFVCNAGETDYIEAAMKQQLRNALLYLVQLGLVEQAGQGKATAYSYVVNDGNFPVLAALRQVLGNGELSEMRIAEMPLLQEYASA